MTKPSSAAFMAVCITLLALPTRALAVLPPPTVEWTRQFGTPAYENSAVVASDALGNVFVAGQTDGNFSGGPATANSAYIRKYDSAGTATWTRQVAPVDFNGAYVALAADGLGNSYLAGETTGNVAAPNAGATDFFIRKFDSIGGTLWTRQVGTPSYDTPRDAVVDSLGNLYVTGFTGANLGGPSAGSYDAFLTKYDSLGNQIWTRQFGSPVEDYARGVATDGLGNIYVAGVTAGSLFAPYGGGSADIFLAKYDQNGNSLWARQVSAPSYDLAYDVAADATGNVYLVGSTSGTLGGANAGSDDVLVIRYDSAGNTLWARQTGTAAQDIAFGAATDGLGNLYLSGVTGGSLASSIAGQTDTFAMKYRFDGTPAWAYQVGSSGYEFGGNLSHDGLGNVYLSAVTEGAIGAPSAGFQDSFVVKLHDPTFVPEPSSLLLSSFALLLMFGSRRRFGG
jgi:hypothetical protein